MVEACAWSFSVAQRAGDTGRRPADEPAEEKLSPGRIVAQISPDDKHAEFPRAKSRGMGSVLSGKERGNSAGAEGDDLAPGALGEVLT